MPQGVLRAARHPHREERRWAEGVPKVGVSGELGRQGMAVLGGWEGHQGDGMAGRPCGGQEGPAGGSPKPTFDIFTVPF